MTAEVAILNKRAVALAADSAMSIGAGGKTYNSSNKVFALSKCRPVGIMIYQDAEFLGVPWETIIKLYRAKMRRASFDTLEEYAESFFKFLADGRQGGLFGEVDEQDGIAASMAAVVERVAANAFAEIQERLAKGEDVNFSDEVPSALSRASAAIHAEIKTRPFLDGWTEADERTLTASNTSFVSEQWKRQTPPGASEIPGDLFEACAGAALRQVDYDGYSGIVIAGFGERDIFPKLSARRLRGVRDGRLMAYPVNQLAITTRRPAAVQAFAQREMVDTFMKGVDPAHVRVLDDALNRILCEQYPEELLNEAPSMTDEQRAVVKSGLVAMGQASLDSVRKELRNLMVSNEAPIYRAVEFLEKDDLASMALALVNLTSLKRRVTLDVESVGGPIDVAVISKADGFIWLQRKHYFEPRLNHNFFVNYAGDDNHERKAQFPAGRRSPGKR